jgi:DNA-binding NtrC family response regulator
MEEKKSILIVDDEPSVRESLRMILNRSYEVHTAADGREALNCLHEKNIDLVTLDLMMPGVSGVQVLREIKNIDEDIEVVIITAYGNAHNAQDIVRFGAGAMIQKPFNVPDVTSTIGKSLERRKNGVEVKGLIEQIKRLLRVDEGREDEVLDLSRRLCEFLGKRDVSYPCGEEKAVNFTFATDRRPPATQTTRSFEN